GRSKIHCFSCCTPVSLVTGGVDLDLSWLTWTLSRWHAVRDIRADRPFGDTKDCRRVRDVDPCFTLNDLLAPSAHGGCAGETHELREDTPLATGGADASPLWHGGTFFERPACDRAQQMLVHVRRPLFRARDAPQVRRPVERLDRGPRR